MARKSSTKTIALVAIGGFVLYEMMKKQQANAATTNTGILGTLGTDLSNLFSGNSQGGSAHPGAYIPGYYGSNYFGSSGGGITASGL